MLLDNGDFMKKQVLIILLALMLFIGVIIFFINSSHTYTKATASGSVTFVYDDINISKKLSDEDLNTLIELFDNKKLYKDNLTCGFSKNIAVIFDESEIFCIACDECPIIYYWNSEQFFKLTSQENELLRSILTRYGFYFPCV